MQQDDARNGRKPPSSNTGAQNTRQPSLIALVDWVQATLPFSKSLQDVYDILGLKSALFKKMPTGNLGYADHYRYGHISVLTNGSRTEMGHHVIISGQGCREYEQYKKNTWDELFGMILDAGGHFSRIDLAIDDFKPYFKIPYLIRKIRKGECRSIFKSAITVNKYGLKDAENRGSTIYYGSPQSMVQVRMYEKDKERLEAGIQVQEGIYAWNRTEITFRNQRADTVADMLTKNIMDVGKLTQGILKNYIQFVNADKDKNRSRWEVSKFWTKFLDDANRIRISEKAPDRTIERTDTWIDHQVSTGMAMIYIAFDRDLMKMIDYIEKGFTRFTDKEWSIIKQYKAQEMTDEELIEWLDQEVEFVETVADKIKKSVSDTDSKKDIHY